MIVSLSENLECHKVDEWIDIKSTRNDMAMQLS